ncbi:MAG TPA: histidine kinase [Desulfobulbaceae bacterium]|nr:histidine kinase [Desulfobulbaceae bacterium]
MKQIKIALAALTAMAVAAPAMALNVDWHGDLNNRFSYSTQADTSVRTSKDSEKYVSLGGQLYSLGEIPNIDTKKNSKDSDFFGEIKYRMSLNVSDDDKKVKGVVGFEFGSAKFGGPDMPFGGDKNNFELMWAYTDIELPFDPASRLIVGLQPVGYNPLLWSDNAGGVKWVRKCGPWGYSLGWFRDDVAKGTGGDQKTDYDNAYAGDLAYTFSNGNSINAFVVYLESRGEKLSYDFSTTFNAVTGKFDRNVPAIDAQDQQIWLGLSGKGKWQDITGQFTGMYLTGELKALDQKFDREAYLFHGQLDYKLNNTTFTLGGLYASGDKSDNDGKLKNFDVIDISTSMIGSVIIFDNFADDNSLSQAPYLFDKGYALLYAGARHDLTEKAWLWGRYLWHNTAEKLAGEDEVGHEFVVGAGYQIMKGLTAEINAGYLLAGDLWKSLGTDGDGDDVFRTDARIRFVF